ncbi:phosphoketolase [Streptomyces sp. SID4919]|uniref:phosphoketolase family protein n=1 Tax=unclassified Streptomyces TaxID=2593676 RepID=UPI0008238EBD|nr:phosphoketolase [Streptomyces sp. AmelKG-E11A]MYY10055.1 phosphoketolase [Streptomyces sp. SID4919]SCK50125.1 xylulose-5-phosphate/fructose-6-phosphate phosphoketolase [Streptomyces sp. AmelKG-E11A]
MTRPNGGPPPTPYPRLPDWSRASRLAARAVPDEAVDALWRALNHLCAAQLYLDDNPRLARRLAPTDVKESPRGHWGVCPPVNWMLAHLGPLTARRPVGGELLVLHGAGHAGPSVLAHAYLNNALCLTGRGPGWSMAELRALVSRFPHPGTLGGEVTPLVPGVRYTGGQLGPALAVAQGMALDAPHRLVVPLIGDGELETGATAAAWLARRALVGSGHHGAVLPVVLANGLRMGGPSLLAGMDGSEVHDHFTGLGYEPFAHDGTDVTGFRRLLDGVLARLRPLDDHGRQPMIVLTMPKGHTGPERVGERQLLGPPAVHKTPLRDPRRDEAEFAALETWLTSYRPTELFTTEGRPADLVRRALPGTPSPPPTGEPRTPPPASEPLTPVTISTTIRERADAGGFRLFSPDEIASNRLELTADGTLPTWATEILNEEVCHAWLQGFTETGRDALLATYEAFAPVNTSLLVQHLKHRGLRYAAGHGGLPNVNYLITSLGWRNTHTHQNPGLVSSMLETENGSVHVYTPADATRAAAVLTVMLAGRDRVNFLLTDKHGTGSFPPDTLREELTDGAAVWPHLSHRSRRPDLVLASAGDVPARELSTAATLLRTTRPDLKIRYAHVNDLAVLGPAPQWPCALTERRFTRLFTTDTPVLMAVPTHAGAVRALLAARGVADRFHVVGYRDPGRPTTAEGLLEACGMSAAALAARAAELPARPGG